MKRPHSLQFTLRLAESLVPFFKDAVLTLEIQKSETMPLLCLNKMQFKGGFR